jgi:predicted SAM-dependent methyltransferase
MNLHIGGKVRHPEWKILDIAPGNHVDFVGEASDLSRFPDESIKNIYASHVLEHLSYSKEVLPCLKEWYRVLDPAGTLFISVPNLEALCRLFASGSCTPDEQFYIVRVIMGGQIAPHDYHKAAFYPEMLAWYLEQAGFRAMKQVDSFGIFNDSSEIRVRGTLISLNVIAHK